MTAPRTTFADVLRVREFRWLWLAGVQSQVGDQLARVALSVLVFDRTGSPLEAAVIYGLTFAPSIVGGVGLAWLADRLPRRGLMVGCDLIRAALLTLMTIPHLPTLALSALIVASVLVGAPFGAAQKALTPEILGEHYVAGSGLRMMSDQVTQVLGFALGAAAVGAVGARAGLGLDAISFAVSATIIWLTVHPRPGLAASGTRDHQRRRHPIRVIGDSAELRLLLGFGWLAGLFIIPEAVAAPYARSVGGGGAATGLLLASIPAGGAVGALVLARFVTVDRRSRIFGPLAICTGLPLMACWTTPGLAASCVLWFLSGAASAYQLVAAATFVQTVPNSRRGGTLGFASSGLVAIQGVGAVVGGLVADRLDVGVAVASAGALGSLVAIALTLAWRNQAGSSVVGQFDAERIDVTDRS
jgi:predicted MFS family arabinose efflux permease